MRSYELVLVFRTSISEVQRKKLLETVKSWFKDLKIAKEEEWGQKVLAYPIKKELAGFYYLMSLEGEGVPKDLEKRLLQNENILRHLLIRKK